MSACVGATACVTRLRCLGVKRHGRTLRASYRPAGDRLSCGCAARHDHSSQLVQAAVPLAAAIAASIRFPSSCVARRFRPRSSAAPAPAARAQSVVTPQPAAEPPQDLKRIRLIDAATESGLSRLGVTRYAQIAGWTAADVARISKHLGVGDRINEEKLDRAGPDSREGR